MLLAIIALIAVPIVLKIIESSRESSDERSAELYIDAVEKKIVANQLTSSNDALSEGYYKINSSGNLCLNTNCSSTLEIKIKGTKPTGGRIDIVNNKIDYYKLKINNKEIANKKDTDESCFEFADGAITSYNPDCGTDVVIPSKIAGATVTMLEVQAFADFDITSVVIPDSVEAIGEEAFGSHHMANIIIPNSVTHIGYRAFYGLPLTSIVIPSSVVILEDSAFYMDPSASVIIKGKTDFADFESYDYNVFGSEFDESKIIWEP